MADRLTERRGRNLQGCRGGGEPAVLCDLPEGEQSVELVESHSLKNIFIRHSVLGVFLLSPYAYSDGSRRI